MGKRNSLFLFYVIATVVFLSILSCGGGGSDSVGETPIDPGSTNEFGIIAGKIIDDNGSIVAGATINADGKSATSNEQGFFSVENIQTSDRTVVNFSKEGYVNASVITKIQAGVSAYLEPIMAQVEHTESISSIAGGTVATVNGCKVTIEPNTLVDSSDNPYDGQATIAITTFDPTTERGLVAFPGEFKGVGLDGVTGPFESYGYADISITGMDGDPLQLAPGESATVEIPIAQSLLLSAPDPIPLWYYNKVDGTWYEEGNSTQIGSTNIYRGTVTHFSPWNCDVRPEDREEAWVEGRVVDGSGNPVQGATVRIWATGGGIWSAGEPSTAQDGSFIVILPAGRNANYKVSRGGVSTQPKSITTPIQGEVLDLGDIQLGGVPKVRITLTWGNIPEDLDAHLTVPTDGLHEHIYFANDNQLIEGAKLDTDDTNGKGPEIITIYELNNGTYRYSVHHYVGSGSLRDSEAKVTVDVPGLGLYPFSPLGTDDGSEKDCWHVCDIVANDGKIVSVTTVDSYTKEVSSSDADAFSP